MKAKLITKQENGKNLSNDKELIAAYSVVGINANGELSEGVTCRVWTGRSRSALTIYATIWTHGRVYTSGHGRAGGGGYHKISAAVGSAVADAGIELDEGICGRGDGAVRDALLAIASDILGLSKCIFVSHG